MVRAVVTIVVEGDSYADIEAKAESISVAGSTFEMSGQNGKI